MTQEESWMRHYTQLMDFMRCNGRRPSKYKDCERGMLNWLKHNKKLAARGKLTPHRQMLFQRLLNRCQEVRRVNQYASMADCTVQSQELPLPF